MQARQIWIKSKNAWTTTISDTWISLSKSSGAANDPIGEFVEVTVTDNISIMQRNGYIDVSSAGQTIRINITQKSGQGDEYELVNEGYDLTNDDFDLINTQ